MKMAKPSAKDIAAAEELQQVLNALDQNQRWGCAALEDATDFFQLIDDDEFDPEQGRHAQALYNKLVTLMWENPSFHNRVISGMCHVIMYEKNEIIDPDSDCIDLHPRFAEMWNDLKRETQAARYWNKRYHQVVAERDEARAKLAAMESQKPVASHYKGAFVPWHTDVDPDWQPLFARPVPADKPAVAVPDDDLLNSNLDQPWSMRACVKKLVEAAGILLDDRCYDGHGHELISEARAKASEYLSAPSHSQQSAKAVPHWVAIESAEDAPAGDTLVVWDGCDISVDFTETEVDYGTTFWSNGTEATHYLVGLVPPSSCESSPAVNKAWERFQAALDPSDPAKTVNASHDGCPSHES